MTVGLPASYPWSTSRLVHELRGNIPFGTPVEAAAKELLGEKARA
jgi:hypothetical protein